MFKSIESLRITSALMVLFAHTPGISIPLVSRFLGANYFLGSIGVDIFFVISGFVMHLSATKASTGTYGASHFLYNRLVRVFPLYILITIFFAHKTHALHYNNIDNLIKSILLLPTRDGQLFVDPILTLGWTLRFEMFFYLIVSIGIYFNKKILFPTIGIAISLILGFTHHFYFGAPIIIEFIFGYLISQYLQLQKIQKESLFSINVFYFICSIALVLLASRGRDWGESIIGTPPLVPRMWIEYVFHDVKYSLPRFIVWGIPAALLVYYSLLLEKTFKWRAAKLGQYTYAVYLMQVFTTKMPMRLKEKYPDSIALLISLLSVSILAYIFHHYYDLKVRKYFQSNFNIYYSQLLRFRPRWITQVE